MIFELESSAYSSRLFGTRVGVAHCISPKDTFIFMSLLRQPKVKPTSRDLNLRIMPSLLRSNDSGLWVVMGQRCAKVGRWGSLDFTSI